MSGSPYTITASDATGGTFNPDSYTIGYSGGVLTVSARAITVTANNLSKSYGEDVPALTYRVTSGGLLAGDQLSGTLATTASANTGVGSYAISQGTLASANYAITFEGGTLAVTLRASASPSPMTGCSSR